MTYIGDVQESRIDFIAILVVELLHDELSTSQQTVSAPVLSSEEEGDGELRHISRALFTLIVGPLETYHDERAERIASEDDGPRDVVSRSVFGEPHLWSNQVTHAWTMSVCYVERGKGDLQYPIKSIALVVVFLVCPVVVAAHQDRVNTNPGVPRPPR